MQTRNTAVNIKRIEPNQPQQNQIKENEHVKTPSRQLRNHSK